MIEIDVIYALPDREFRQRLSVAEGCTAAQALALSDLPSRLPGVELADLDMGIFSRLLDGRAAPRPDSYVMQHGDRLELYRPLQIDPKKARLQRAKKRAGSEGKEQT